MKYLEDIYVLQLTRFSQMLRNEGLAVGYKETMDAFEALQAIEVGSRDEFKGALRCIYAKSRQEQLIFDRIFDQFFVSAEMKRAFIEKTRAEAQEIAQRRLQVQEELKVNGQSMNLREDLEETYVQMSEEKREQLRRIMERNEENLHRSPQLYANFIRSVFQRYLMEEQLEMEDAALNVEEKDPDLALLFRDISQFQDFEIPKASELIAKIAQQLNSDLSRRKKGGGHSGSLDFKKTIRMGLQSGGTFNKLAFRRKRKHRRQLILLCDGFDLTLYGLPVIQGKMLAHAFDGGDLHTVEAGGLDSLGCFTERIAFEQYCVYTKLYHIRFNSSVENILRYPKSSLCTVFWGCSLFPSLFRADLSYLLHYILSVYYFQSF